MGWRFVVKDEIVAIQNGSSLYELKNPHLNPRSFMFHSKFGYMATIQTMTVPELTFDAIQPIYVTRSTGKKGKGSVTYPVPNSGYRMHFLGDVTGQGLDDPILLFYEYNGDKYHMGNMPIYPARQGSYLPRVGARFRILSTVVAPYGSGYGIYILERYSLTGNPPIPSQTITNVRVLRTNISRDNNYDNNYILKISPTEFIAGYGQVNLLTRFLREGVDSNAFYVGSGQTFAFDNLGNAAFYIPPGTPNGQPVTVREGGNTTNYKWKDTTFKSIVL